MIELIQNMDWVLRTTLYLWIFFLFLRFGGGILVGIIWGLMLLALPRVSVVTGIIGVCAIWGLLIVRVVFTIWSLFIILGYML